jgi:hypothetical protein
MYEFLLNFHIIIKQNRQLKYLKFMTIIINLFMY